MELFSPGLLKQERRSRPVVLDSRLPGLPGKNKMKNRGVQGDAVVVNDFWVADTNGCERLRPLWKIVRTQRREETRRQRRTGYTIL
jgi:hypothetical protein